MDHDALALRARNLRLEGCDEGPSWAWAEPNRQSLCVIADESGQRYGLHVRARRATVVTTATILNQDAGPYHVMMPGVPKQLALVRDAIEIVLGRLAALPPSPEVEELRLRAGDCLQQADGWSHKAPTIQQREALMKRVLGLHTAVARLERAKS